MRRLLGHLTTWVSLVLKRGGDMLGMFRVLLRALVQVPLAAALLIGFAGGSALAQERNITVQAAVPEDIRVALVIGNAAYKEAPLANPTNDAADMAKALRENGFKVIERTNVNNREMRQAIREFGNELRGARVGLTYFAGHGIQIRGANYLIPVREDIENEADVEDRGLDANYVLRTMEEAGVRVSLLVLDACRNNPFGRSMRSASRGLAQMNAATGSLVAFATSPGSTAADGGGRNGVYTKHLIASLKEETDILKVFQKTRAGVVKETAGRQTPWESISLIGDFHFRTPVDVAAVRIEENRRQMEEERARLEKEYARKSQEALAIQRRLEEQRKQIESERIRMDEERRKEEEKRKQEAAARKPAVVDEAEAIVLQRLRNEEMGRVQQERARLQEERRRQEEEDRLERERKAQQALLEEERRQAEARDRQSNRPRVVPSF